LLLPQGQAVALPSPKQNPLPGTPAATTRRRPRKASNAAAVATGMNVEPAPVSVTVTIWFMLVCVVVAYNVATPAVTEPVRARQPPLAVVSTYWRVHVPPLSVHFSIPPAAPSSAT